MARAKRSKRSKSTRKSRAPSSPRKKSRTPPVAKEAKPLEAAATPAPPPKELKDLGPPPEDPLQQQAYLYKVLVMSAYDVARDEKLSPRERRKELRTISAAAQKLMPRARLAEAEARVLGYQAEIDKKARERQGAKLEPLPKLLPAPAPAAEVKPTDHVEEPQP